jgi:hypothetical protein
MNCEQVKVLLPSFVSDELFDAEREMVEQHLAGCAGCRSSLESIRSLSRQLALLQTLPVDAEIADRTISRIKSESVFVKPRRWLRPALVGASAIIVVCVLTTIFALPARAPEDVLAQALANTQSLKSFRVYDFAEIRPPETTEWLTNYYKEVDIAGPDRIHTKARFTLDLTKLNNDSAIWENDEFIIYGNTVYLKDSTQPLDYDPEIIGQGWSDFTASLQQPDNFLKLLANTKMISNEEIDGILCLCYKSQVNMDAWVKQQLADAEERAHLHNYSWTEEHAQVLEDMWRSRQVVLEFWIGKRDQTIHQWRMTDTADGNNTYILPDGRETIRYYDFNEEITVEPPLDDQGNILPGWRIQEEP